MRPNTRSLVPTALAAGLLLAGSAVAEITSEEFSVAPGGTLTLSTDRGSVEIRPTDGSSVKVLAKHDTDEFVVTMTQTGNDVEVVGELPSEGWLKKHRGYKVEFTVDVPRQYNLDLRTAGGPVRVGDLDGNVAAKTSGGPMNLGHVTGSVALKTSGGPIRVESIGGPAMLKTSGGSISLGEVGGDAEVSTSGGSISIDKVHGALHASTSGGSVSAAFAKAPSADSRLHTSGGSVSVALPSDAGFEIDAETSGGRVVVDMPVTVEGHVGRSALRGKVGAGGPMLHLRTSGGGIRVRGI